jgi:hypothetical protein
MKKFECHITIVDEPSIARTSVKKIVEELGGWKFSCIQGDPDLGAASFCYATRWFEDKQHAVTMTHMYKDQFVREGLSVVRVKVEEVVHDSRMVNGEWKEIR